MKGTTRVNIQNLTAGILVAIASTFLFPHTGLAAEVPPRLVLQITVDQLRGDLPRRYLAQMGSGGFRYLLENGVVYGNAHHAHAATETIVGHATLATGAHPSDHGLIGNIWFDRVSGELTYNIEDARYPLLTGGADVDKATEIDPTQRAARTDGRSPAAMLVSTFSDELAIHTADQAKVFSVSVKDRGAVSMAGHAGKAFWFSKATGEFVTSRFYYDQYPAAMRAKTGNSRKSVRLTSTATKMSSPGRSASEPMAGYFRILMAQVTASTLRPS
jgi:hypothetical protein